MKRLIFSSYRGVPERLKILRSGALLMMFLMLFSAIVNGQRREITGTVYDSEGMPVIGATIIVKGTTRGTTTDINGKFKIECASEEILMFSYVGMKTEEIEVGVQSVINLTMVPEAETMEEVVVVGYGVQKKESVVGAISQVSGDKLQSIKMGGSMENTLQGRLPGLTVIMTDPTPGEEAMGGYYGASPIQMVIRGTSSMGSNTPLIIVDGVERPFTNLDPNEVSSISILKDASATAVYGVKGANGVIIVNTKRGRSGAVQLDFSANLSAKQPAMLPEYMNAYETMKLRNEAWANDGMWNLIVSDEILEHYRTQDLPYLYPDFDWMDYYFQTGFDQNYNLNARGGNDFVQYFVSIGFLDEGDVWAVGNDFPYSYDKKNAHYWHQRYNFRNNLDFKLTKTTKLSVNLGGNVKSWGKPQDYFTQEQWFEPVTVMPYYPAEAVDLYPDEVIPYDQDGRRPMIRTEQGEVRLHWIGGFGFWRFKSNELNSDIRLDQDLGFITKGLSLLALYSYNTSVVYRQDFNLPEMYGYYLDPETLLWSRYTGNQAEDFDTPQPPLQVNNNDYIFQGWRSHYYEARLSYIRSFGRHNVSGIGVFSRRQSRGIADFPHYEENWVGRATYNYNERYFAEGSISYTGSEKFAPGLRFGTFPSFAGGWVLSNEDFFASLKNTMNLVKLRYSYGIVGSDAGISRWLYVSEFTEGGGGVSFGYPMQYYPYIQEGNIPVLDATWEKAIKQNIGIELAFLQNLFTLSLDLFNEKREDVLQARRRVPSWVGVSAIQGNIGSTKSHGFEVEFGINKYFANGIYLLANTNISASENRVVYFDEPETIPFNLKAEGKPVDIARRMEYYSPGTGLVDGGFYQDFDELFMWPVVSGGNPITGDLKFLDFNGDGNVDEQDRVVAQYPTLPNVTWNAQLGGGYKNLSFDVNFYGISNTQAPTRQGGMFHLFPFAQNKDNAFTAHADHWTPDNRDPEFPAVHYHAEDQYNYQISHFSMLEGKYIRLRNARINYRLSFNALRRIGISQLDLSLIGTNLWTWKKLGWGGDPEGFNHGVDFGAYPQLKRYTLEIRATF
ncbi:MAG: TonB-dependent receptor [Bacteroidales bacterium]|nr:TonB-dependent receptor [Bacteroidales bacterium]